MLSAIIGLFIFSIPSLIYSRKLQHQGKRRREAWAVVGLQIGKPNGYWLALGTFVILTPLLYLAIQFIPASVLHNPNVVISNNTSAIGIITTALLALAEEIFFRGFIAGLLQRKYGFTVGNNLQAFIFLVPHLLLLLISTSLWPLIIVQFIAGWLLGLVRYKSGSIMPGWLAHAAANILAPVFLIIWK